MGGRLVSGMNTLAGSQGSFELSWDRREEEGRKGLKTTPSHEVPRATTTRTPPLRGSIADCRPNGARENRGTQSARETEGKTKGERRKRGERKAEDRYKPPSASAYGTLEISERGGGRGRLNVSILLPTRIRPANATSSNVFHRADEPR